MTYPALNPSRHPCSLSACCCKLIVSELVIVSLPVQGDAPCHIGPWPALLYPIIARYGAGGDAGGWPIARPGDREIGLRALSSLAMMHQFDRIPVRVLQVGIVGSVRLPPALERVVSSHAFSERPGPAWPHSLAVCNP